MCFPSTLRFFREHLFSKKYILICNVLDIPYWRLNDDRYKKAYEFYKSVLELSDYVTTISKYTSVQLKKLWNIESIPLFRTFDNNTIE